MAARVGTISDFYMGSGVAVRTNMSGTNQHTVDAGCRLLIAVIHLRSGISAPAISTVTYNGVAMTLVPGSSGAGSTTYYRNAIYYLLNPPTGTAYNVAATWTVSSTYGIAFLNILDAEPNVAPLNGVTAEGNSLGASVNVTNTGGNLVLAALSHNSDALCSAFTGTKIYEGTPNSTTIHFYAAGQYDVGQGGAKTMGFTTAFARDWLATGCEIQSRLVGSPAALSPFMAF